MAHSIDRFALTPVTPSMPICPSTVSENIEALPITPPDSTQPFNERSTKIDGASVKKVLHVLSTERDALTHLQSLYAHSYPAQSSLSSAVSHVVASQSRNGKVIFTGVGKSGWIAQKLVATFNSVGIVSTFLHPTEALHGDLGLMRPDDVVVMITYSGKTQELLTLQRHIPSYIPLLVITSHSTSSTCPLLDSATRSSSNSLLLSAPIHITEKESFGLSAPTSSTTVALALGDALALAIADRIHSVPGYGPAEFFARAHPGGQIGADNRLSVNTAPIMSDLATYSCEVPIVEVEGSAKCIDVLRTAVRSPKGWVRVSADHIIAPRRIQRLSQPDLPITDVNDEKGQLVVERTDWISVLGDWTVEECRQWIVKMRTEGNGRGREFLRPGTILGIVDAQSQKSGVVEIEDIVGEDFCDTL